MFQRKALGFSLSLLLLISAVSKAEERRPNSIDDLVKALKSKDSKIRIAAIEKLGKSNDKRAIEPLIEVLKKDENDRVRAESVEALGFLGDKRAVEPLIYALKYDDSRSVHWEVARAFETIRAKEAYQPLIEEFNNAITRQWRDSAHHVASAIGNTRDPRAYDFLTKEILDKKTYHPFIRSGAAVGLGKLGDKRAVEILIGMLEEHDPAAYGAADGLGLLKDKRAVKPLIDALDKEAEHRSHIAEALGEIGDKRAVEPLINLLRDSRSYTRDKAVEALGKIGDKRAIEPLKYVAKIDRNSHTRSNAREALGILIPEEMKRRGYTFDFLKSTLTADNLPYIVFALKSKSKYVRKLAAFDLGELRDKRAIDYLKEALKNEKEEEVKKEITRALSKIETGIKGLLAELTSGKTEEERINAAISLGYSDDKRAVSYLIKGLEDKNARVRRYVINSLGRLGSKEAIKPLTDLLHREDSELNKQIIEYALKALREGSPFLF